MTQASPDWGRESGEAVVPRVGGTRGGVAYFLFGLDWALASAVL